MCANYELPNRAHQDISFSHHITPIVLVNSVTAIPPFQLIIFVSASNQLPVKITIEFLIIVHKLIHKLGLLIRELTPFLTICIRNILFSITSLSLFNKLNNCSYFYKLELHKQNLASNTDTSIGRSTHSASSANRGRYNTL